MGDTVKVVLTRPAPSLERAIAASLELIRAGLDPGDLADLSRRAAAADALGQTAARWLRAIETRDPAAMRDTVAQLRQQVAGFLLDRLVYEFGPEDRITQDRLAELRAAGWSGLDRIPADRVA